MTEAVFGEVSTSLRVQGKAPSERREYLPTGIGSISLRAEGMSPYGRRETLPSNGACISLRAGRATRFERGVLLALGGADRMYWFYRYSLVSCPPLLGKSSYIENVYSMSEVLEGVIPCV